ncbi:MAG: transcription-repair coupling factor [Saprospiraceae bacterium]|nr:transcription-repair coupling factor [Saprospiraceae bacterium]
MDNLLMQYAESRQVESIVTTCGEDHRGRILCSGLIGSQISFIVSALASRVKNSQIIIAHDKEEAAYIQNSIANILSAKTIGFFPDSFKRPLQFEELDNNNILERTENINKVHIKDGRDSIIVTYPEALFEKVVDPNILDKEKIIVSVGESLDVDTAIELLVEFGFERVDFVYEPGQFSIRGGIVDIFTYGNEWPYRIELFDDEVESIRTFHPTTQLSQKEIRKVSIIPNINSKFTQQQKVSLFKVFASDTIVWISNFGMLLDKLQSCFEGARDYASGISSSEQSEILNILDERAFIYPKDVLEEIGSLHTILLNNGSNPIKVDHKIVFNSAPQPPFNKNFSMLIDNLERNQKNGIDNYIFTDSVRQIERFYSIFEDLDAKVQFHPVDKAIHEGFIDKDLKVAVYTDHQIFNRFHKYRLRKGFTKEQAISLKMLRELKPGDYVTHMDHGIGRYSGLEKIDINGHVQESIRIIYQNNDVLYVSINSLHKISKFAGKDGTAPKLHKLGGDAWKTLKRKTKRKIKDIAKELIRLYAKRKASKGFAFPPDGYLQNELEASFIYEDTPDQELATIAMKEDMQKPNPMDRLICGDVGFGKTEVAIRGAFKAVVGGKQVAILVPTTILALQHYKTISERLAEFELRIDYVNRFRTAREKREIFEKLKEGKLDIVIGTHAILNKDIGFKDLGLLIIDEEQKFGVAAKEKLRRLKVNVDTLTLTATPIPRTLQFSLMAARDLSIIRTPPPNRQPIHTERRIFSDELIKDAIYYEINRGGQVFFVHNRVKTLPDITTMIRRLCPDLHVSMAHGQMESKQLETTLIDFIDGRFDVLVCTNIIETGLDIPNANTIIINNAHHFGLSDLHQLRGRVGRSNQKAFCYLFAPPLSVLTPEARKRIKTLEEFSDLGSGFHIAMKDLDIRGAGNLLGGEQSGFISDIGFETYQKILEEAVLDLKETEFKDVFKEEVSKKRSYVRDVEVETDIEMLIPDDYISIIQERLNLYTEMDQIKDEEELSAFKVMMKDRFGPIPHVVNELFSGLKIRWKAKELGFERVSLKKRKLRCYFVRNPQSVYYETDLFKGLLQYISTEGQKFGLNLKQSKNFLILIKDDVKSLKEANIILQRLIEDVVTAPV